MKEQFRAHRYALFPSTLRGALRHQWPVAEQTLKLGYRVLVDQVELVFWLIEKALNQNLVER